MKKILMKEIRMKKIKNTFSFFSVYKNDKSLLSKNKENLQKEARERYKNLSEEEKSEKRRYTRERFRNLYKEEKKQKHQYGRE